MPKYEYRCPQCGHEYSETRAPEHPQWVEVCPKDGCEGSLVEVK